MSGDRRIERETGELSFLNAEITFVKNRYDRDGFPFDTEEDIYKVIGGTTKTVTEKCGIKRIYKA
jgi:hypothetical protein